MGNRAVQNQRVQASAQLFSQPVRSTTLLWLGGSCGLPNLRYIRVFRIALAFGLAQAIMPTLGWLAGRTVNTYIAGYDHWIVFGLLTIVGGRMIWEAFRSKEGEKAGLDITRGWLLLTLAVATSIDSLAVGLSLAFLETHILLDALIIGLVAFLISNLGFYLGRKASGVLGQRARIIGGIILIGIGLRVNQPFVSLAPFWYYASLLNRLDVRGELLFHDYVYKIRQRSLQIFLPRS